MTNFWFLTVSNKPRLRDPTQVEAIISRYWFDFDCDVKVEPGPDGKHCLCIQGDGWPAAWLMPPDTLPEDFCLDFDTPGQEEFAEFLTEIAHHLAEPLIVQAIGTTQKHYPLLASEWKIEPGSSQLIRREFTSSHNQESSRECVPTSLQLTAP